jgi:phosphoglycerate dehydrogenase-like enzyme
VSNIPSGGTGNAISCAEHAIYLMLATLRFHNAMADRCVFVCIGGAGSLGPCPHTGTPQCRHATAVITSSYRYWLPLLAPHRSIRTRRLGVPLGQSLFTKTVLIVGFGSIAKELAVR